MADSAATSQDLIPKGSFLEGKWDPYGPPYFREKPGW